jgi:arsenate reductase
MNILFMCVANSARSQIAEGLARKLLPFARIESAGSEPRTLHPLATAVMAEIDIDISTQYSKSIDALDPSFIRTLDYVITLCQEEVCPRILTGAKKLHWPTPDPASSDPLPQDVMLQRFRAARDAIAKQLQGFTP